MIQYAIIGKIVYVLCKMDSKRLRKIAKELSVLSKVKKSVNQKKTRKLTKKTKRKSRKKPTAKQLKARKLFAQRVKRGDFR